MIYTETDGGLVIAQEGESAAAVARELQRHDSDLQLRLSPSGYWKVYRQVAGDKPLEFVCAWMDSSGNAYPLTMGLVDLVKMLDRNTRVAAPDVDKMNARHREQFEENQQAMIQDLVDDWRVREGRSAMLPRGQSLRMARDKQRNRGVKI